jgi:radical SAM protein with 4Fe4S-binding SPASM domain
LRKLQRHLEEGKIGVVSTAPQFGRSCIVYGSEEGLYATRHAGKGAGKKSMVLSRYIGGCGTGRCYCAIQPNGIVTPCVYIPDEKVGDLRRQSLTEIWDNPLFATLADREDCGDHCGVCNYRAYCGGCRARALAYTGDIQAGDPGCIYNYHGWQEVVEASNKLAEKIKTRTDFALEEQEAQWVAVEAVRAAAASGRLSGMSEEEVRDVRAVTARLKQPLPRAG